MSISLINSPLLPKKILVGFSKLFVYVFVLNAEIFKTENQIFMHSSSQFGM